MKNFETNEELIFGLIIDDLDNTITPANKELLNQWREADPANEITYQEFLNVQVNLDKLVGRLEIDAQQSWESLDKKINDQPDLEELVFLKEEKQNHYWLKIAAAILLVSSVGFYFVWRNQDVVIHTDQNTALTNIVLPDGTEVKLNAATSISYHKNTFKTDRKLELLKGEAFIHVAKGSSSQFRVDLGELEAKDIGTRFNISKTEHKTTVIVEEGEVALRQNSTAKELRLTPGKIGLYNPMTGALIAEDNQDLNYKAWIDKSFVFKAVAVGEVAGQLQKVYNFKIDIEGDRLKNRKLTARLKYQTLDSALAVISASLQCKVKKSEDTFILYDN
ncbi:FecR family protein [Pedobacter caeni]|uniref:FecR family protein n=1 Tax=Pedobacter caeni TaxID=288992 RepID=A0A1M5DB60_9SPHI|nr:FecR domain-containing protein [Pedobacter caeni]SHF64239.1 FecR family protein [Pedobacter caeni]